MAETEKEAKARREADYRERMKAKGYRWLGMWVPDGDRKEVQDLAKFKSYQFEQKRGKQ